MSYLQITTPDGRQRGLKFNQGALIEFQSLVDVSNLQSTSGYALLYAGLKANAFVKREELTYDVDGKEQPVTFEIACDWADKLDDAVFDQISAAFQSSIAYQKLITIKEGEEKKNLNTTETSTEPTATA